MFEKNRRTCRKCRLEYKKKHRIKCGNCGVEFKSARRKTKFCSIPCAGEAKKERIVVKCSYCNKTKEVTPSKAKVVESHYCNQDCRTEHLKIIMIGEGNPNYKRFEKPCDGCGIKIKIIESLLTTLKHNFCSMDCYKKNIGRYYSGENNPNWNHELTEEERNDLRKYPEYYEWRSKVYERDNYTCRACGDDSGGNLNAHHIENYSENKEKRTCLDNGITLCISCHKEFHMTYGYSGNNMKQLSEFMKYKENSTNLSPA